MTDAAFFASALKPAISGFDGLTNLQAASRVAQLAHVFVDLATTTDTLGPPPSGAPNSLQANMAACTNDVSGQWCAGTAHICAQMLNASGRVNRAWYYSYGLAPRPDWGGFTHACVLALVDYTLYHFDPYENWEFITPGFLPQPYLTSLQQIRAGCPPQSRQFHADKDVHASNRANLLAWASFDNAPEFRPKPSTADLNDGLGRVVVTAERFQASYFERDRVDAELVALGHPCGDWNYLHLYPLSLVDIPYASPDATTNTVLGWINASV